MDRELEDLIKAYEAVLQARDARDHKLLLSAYELKLDEVISRCPNTDRKALQRAIRNAHLKWLAAQRKPPSMPPKA